MYAFALLDLVAREAILHTDGGIKPLYVMTCPDRGETWFASTLSPLHGAAGGGRALDVGEMAWRMVCPSPRRALAMGRYPAEELRGRVALVPSAAAGTAAYPAPSGPPPPAPPAWPPDIDEVREAYEQAAREAGEVSGPVAVLLSGGLDSAGVAAWCGRSDALAITGRFEPRGGPFDESPGAAAVASAHGLAHEVVDLSDRDLLLDLPDVMEALEEPIGGPGSLPMHRLARRARAHGRVVLTGTGGDERFGGYARIALALGREGSWTAGYEALAARMAAAGADPWRRWLAAIDRADDLLPWLSPEFRASLPVEAARLEVREALFGLSSGLAGVAAARALVEAEIRTTLRMLLHVEDRVTMALALESRPVPCLSRLPEVASRLPEGALVGPDGETKRALRAALEGRIPESVRTDRRKRGFPTPFHRAATGAGRDLAEAVIGGERFRSRGWWDVAACRRLLDAQRPAHDRALFTILSHEAWARRFLDADGAARGGP
jgi:asparagine synthase (glutamine-hydrolysing)